MALFVFDIRGSSSSARSRLMLWITLALIYLCCVCSSSLILPLVDTDVSSDEIDDLRMNSQENYDSSYQSAPWLHSLNYIESSGFRPTRARLLHLLLKSAVLRPNYQNVRPISSSKRYTAQAFHAMRGWKENELSFHVFFNLHIVHVLTFLFPLWS